MAAYVPTPSSVRFRVDPRFVDATKAARRLGITLKAFQAIASDLYIAGFPRPDPILGNYDLEAINRWADMRNSRLFNTTDLTTPIHPVNAGDVFSKRLELIGNGSRED